MGSERIEKLAELGITLKGCPDIPLTTDFVPNRLFLLYVGVEGTVKGIDIENNTINRKFVVGYHPIPFRKIFSSSNGTTATDLGAAWIDL